MHAVAELNAAAAATQMTSLPAERSVSSSSSSTSTAMNSARSQYRLEDMEITSALGMTNSLHVS